MTRDVREHFKLEKTHSTLHKIKFDYGVLILKAYKIFSVHTIRVKFENKTNTAAESLESSPREAQVESRDYRDVVVFAERLRVQMFSVHTK